VNNRLLPVDRIEKACMCSHSFSFASRCSMRGAGKIVFKIGKFLALNAKPVSYVFVHDYLRTPKLVATLFGSRSLSPRKSGHLWYFFPRIRSVQASRACLNASYRAA
jgi:hypothetical protein